MNVTCGRCRHFKAVDRKIGDCRRFPPQLKSPFSSARAELFPTVHATAFCGEWSGCDEGEVSEAEENHLNREQKSIGRLVIPREGETVMGFVTLRRVSGEEWKLFDGSPDYPYGFEAPFEGPAPQRIDYRIYALLKGKHGSLALTLRSDTSEPPQEEATQDSAR